MKNFETPADALQDLRQRGYEADFDLQSDCLYCSSLDLRLYEEEFNVDEVYHFKGSPNPGGNTVLYALTSPTGVKGIIIDGPETTIPDNSCDITRRLQNHLAVAGLSNPPVAREINV